MSGRNLSRIVFFSALIPGVFAVGCGVKAPPLPPEPVTPQQSERSGWSPDRDAFSAPSATPSPRPTGR